MTGTLKKLPAQAERKAGTTSSHHGPYVLGHTRATMVGTEGSYWVTRCESLKPISVRIGVYTRGTLPGLKCSRNDLETDQSSDLLQGAAWLSSARAVRCWVKSRNERNPRS